MELLTKYLLRKAYLTGFIDGQENSLAPKEYSVANAKSRLEEVEAMIKLLQE